MTVFGKDDPEFLRFDEEFRERYAGTFRVLSGRYTHTDGSPCYCYAEGNVDAESGRESRLGKGG